MLRSTLKFLADAWVLARPYWSSEERWSARLLLAAIVGLNLGMVWLNVEFNEWNNGFYNALQERETGIFFDQLFRFSWLAALFILAGVYELYLTQMLQMRWRRWMTERLLAEWLADQAHYRIQILSAGTDNPDQRIAEDLRLFVVKALTLTMGLLSSVVTLVSFLAILWQLSGSLTLPLGENGFELPGYMVWGALVYALAGSALSHLIGRPLARLNFQQQKVEADFRFSLIRLRENAESVALYRGEAAEEGRLREVFAAVVGNWWQIMRCRKHLTFFTAGYQQAAVVFPFLVAAPRFFSGDLQLGGLMQTSSAFGQVQGALSWFIDAYVDLAEWRATIQRLKEFQAAIAAARAAATKPRTILRHPDGDGALRTERLELELPPAAVAPRPLLRGDLCVTKGERVLIAGPSGSGKSMLVRTLAGLWPFGQGRIHLPAGPEMMVLPQRPYLPVSTLRAALSFPAALGRFPDAELHEVLTACGLEGLTPRLDEFDHWAQRLSGGEQQRLAVARALLHRPSWLILDEATAACDPASEERLYRLLLERLPGLTLISIGHRPGLAAFHNRRLTISPGCDDRADFSIIEASTP